MRTTTALLTMAAVALTACAEPVALPEPSPPSLQVGLGAGLGSKIVFTKFSESPDQNEFEVAELYVMNEDGTEQRRLTHNTTFDLNPAWSPNGSQVAFQGRQFGDDSQPLGPPLIFLINADGSGQTQLTETPGQVPSWSPNGKQIAFGTADGAAVPGEIVVINVDGTGLTNLTNHPAFDSRPDWSPNGQRIVFQSNRDGNAEIYGMNADGSDPTRLTSNPALEQFPVWSPDGRKIAFISNRDDPRSDIYVMNADGTDVTRLTVGGGRDREPSWSPDGRQVVFDSDRDFVVEQILQAWVINADGTGLRPLTSLPSENGSPGWGPGHAGLPAVGGAPAIEASAPLVVMSGLDNPRGLAFGPEGALYVVEAGRGGAGPCITGPVGGSLCYGPSGAVSRLWNGSQERVASGLPSLAGPTGVAQAGPNDIAFLGRGGAFVTIGLQNDPASRALLDDAGAGFGQVAHLAASGEWRFVTDVAAYEAANNPDGRLRDDGTPFFDSNPYGLLAIPGAHLVTEAGGNALLRVDANGDISLLAVFHSRGSTPPRPSFAPSQFDQFTDAVPTTVVVGPDGAYYVAELTGVPFTDTRANVYRVVPGDPVRLFLIEDACLTGFKAIIDIAFDDRGNLYVLQHSTGAVQQLGAGILVRVTPDQSQPDICAQYRAGTRTTVLGGLTRPTSIAIGPDGALYVTNRGISAGAGEVLRSEVP